MQIHELTQGSPEWHAFRREHFNASDAPAMMGVSPYKTRTELLDEYKSGITKEFDAATQKRLDLGHAFEALARPIAEAEYGEEFFPVVGSLGIFGASFDGLNMLGDTAFEHKTLNDEIRACSTVDELPIYYKIQMQQQCMVGTCSRVVFYATKWDLPHPDGVWVLVESKSFVYENDDELALKIKAGWAQFEKDLATHEVKVAKVEAVAASIIDLPTISIQIKGEVTNSNLPVFKEAATAFIDSINTQLVTDQDFADAEAAVKFCEDAEGKIDAAKKQAISQTESIDELMRTLDFIKSELRNKRLTLEKLVKSEKESRKLAIINKANDAYQFHLENLSEETQPFFVPNANPNFAEAIKGKKTIKSMQDAVDAALANAKAEAELVAQSLRKKIAWFNQEAKDFKFLFADAKTIINKNMDDFQSLVTLRIAEHKQREAAKEEVKHEPVAQEQQTEQTTKPVEANDQIARRAMQPTALMMIHVIADHYHVEACVARDWLATTEFMNIKVAA